MSDSFVSTRDYQGLQGFGGQEDFAELSKALVAGSDINAPGAAPGVGFPLRPESLEQTLKNTTYKVEDAVLWRNVTKLPAFNTVEEFNRITSFGAGISAFVAESDLPESDDATYQRAYSLVKFMGTTRAVSHVMSLVRTPAGYGNAVAQETVNGTAWLIRQLERALFVGNSAMIPVQFDGLEKQILDGAPNAALNTIDMRGRPLTEDAVNDGCLVVKTEPNYGRATDLYLPDGAFSDLAKQFYPAERVPFGPAQTGGMVGLNVQGMYSQFGPIKFNASTFLQFGPLYGAAQGSAAKIPTTPTESVAPASGALAGSEVSYFTADWIGAYHYKVCAINRYGRSATVAMTGPVSSVLNQKITMTVADGATVGTAFELYRSDKDGAAATAKYVKTVARSGATTVITDFNIDLPGTAKGYLIQQNLDFFAVKQLAPFMKIPLATIDLSIRWAQVIYLALQVYAPGKAVIFKNIGRAAGSAGVNNASLISL